MTVKVYASSTVTGTGLSVPCIGAMTTYNTAVTPNLTIDALTHAGSLVLNHVYSVQTKNLDGTAGPTLSATYAGQQTMAPAIATFNVAN